MKHDSIGLKYAEHIPMIIALHTKCNSLSEGTPRWVATWTTPLRIFVFSLFILSDFLDLDFFSSSLR